MKARALVLGIVVSMVLLGVAGTLYALSSGGAERQYRAAVTLTRRIQQLSAQWSVEIARVKSDPLADFDPLAAFIPRMEQLKRELSGTVRGIAELPDRLASDVNAYLSVLEAQEERIERFKSGYAVVRNSTRYLPLAADNVMRQAQEERKEALAQSIAMLEEDIDLFLSDPVDTLRARLSQELQRLREASVAQPPALSIGLSNFVAHADVLLDRQGLTEELFKGATSSNIANLTERLVGSFEFEISKQALRNEWYERGMLGVIGLLALFWVGLALQQRMRVALPEAPAPLSSERADAVPLPAAPEADAVVLPAAPEADAAPLPAAPEADAPVEPLPAHEDALESPEEEQEDLRAAMLATAGHSAGIEAEDIDIELAPAPTTSRKSIESELMHGFLARYVAENLVASAHRIATRMDYLRQTQSRMQQTLRDNNNLLTPLSDGANLEEEIEAAGAVAIGVRQEMNAVADLARRLAASAAIPDGACDRDMIDLNSCVDEALRVTRAEESARVTKRLGSLPEIFASHVEIRILLTKVIENSVQAVRGIENRPGTIKINTMRRNDHILITVIDNGTGISAERRAKMFRPLYTSRYSAMGLGLTLANYLAGKYEGDIKVNSRPDQGTVTRITLPVDVPGQ